MPKSIATHTPGPWLVSVETYPTLRGNYTIHSLATEDCIAEIPAAWSNRAGNAPLIAAAPAMFDALRTIANQSIGDDWTIEQAFAFIKTHAKAAIDGLATSTEQRDTAQREQ